MTSSDRSIAALEAELAAAKETVKDLRRRLESPAVEGTDADAESSHAIARMQARYEEKSQALVDTEAMFQALYNNLLDMVIVVDNEGCVQGCNRSAELGLDRDQDELVGLSITDLFQDETGEALLSLVVSGFHGAGTGEVSLPDGRQIDFSIANIDERRSQLVLRDVTPRDRLHEELLNTRRMASVGRMAGGIAHEINNPLAVIQGRVEMLRAVPEMPVEVRARHLDILEEHCRRVSRIVRNLHTFARPRIPDASWLSVPEVMDSVRQSLGRRLERVLLDPKFAPDLRVYADRDQLELVLANLLSGAAESSPAGREVRFSAESRPGGGIEFRIEDEGGSLSRELIEGLRAPYAAGAALVEAGRGLNISISWGIVQEHGGWLTAENKSPRGCSLVFFLPGPDSDSESASHGQPWSILVVDDDRVMCETIAWMLTSEGHRITSVHSAEDAVNCIDSERFDLIITDQRLPGMDGEALIECIRERDPSLAERTLLTSGLLFRPKHTGRYLQKPFSRAQLLKMLGDLTGNLPAQS